MAEATDNQEIEAAELESRKTEDVWHVDDFYGVRQTVLHHIYKHHDKCVIEFHDQLQLAVKADIFTTEQAACTAMWMRLMEVAGAKMEIAKKWKDRANALRKDGAK